MIHIPCAIHHPPAEQRTLRYPTWAVCYGGGALNAVWGPTWYYKPHDLYVPDWIPPTLAEVITRPALRAVEIVVVTEGNLDWPYRVRVGVAYIHPQLGGEPLLQGDRTFIFAFDYDQIVEIRTTDGEVLWQRSQVH